ncbi:chemotaxis protein CheW [Vibrio crassostreae]|uniref:chemotaxis protein CheW n=1 Tax=Vibrio crassostreae TaxID=246167 RepID=UPI001B30CB4E|nr:chemotaxis protein CheW [Vibrio crassostreae]
METKIVENPTSNSLDSDKWITFCISDELYCVSALIVKEVLRYTAITPVPHSPHFVLGLINLRGNVVTVIDGRRRLQVKESELTSDSRIVIIESEECTVGVLVDQVREVINIDKADLDQSPSMTDDKASEYIQSLYHNENELLILLNNSTFLDN